MPVNILNRASFNPLATVFVAADTATAAGLAVDAPTMVAPSVELVGVSAIPGTPSMASVFEMKIGAAVVGGSAANFTALQTRVGPLGIARIFDSGFPSTYVNSTTTFHHSAGRTVAFSFKPSDLQMAALGAGDVSTVNQLRALLGSAAGGGRKIWWCVRHEPENDTTWTPTGLANHRAGWARFADEVHSYGEDWSTLWIMMAYSWIASSGRNPDDWYPGNAYVDIVGIDAYNEGSLDANQTWDSPGSRFGEPHTAESLDYPGDYVQGGVLDWLEVKGKPYALCEYGSITNHNAATPQWCTDAGIAASKPAWITYHAGYHYGVQSRRGTHCKALMYFDSTGRTWDGNGTETWLLNTDDPLSYDAFAGVNAVYKAKHQGVLYAGGYWEGGY